ncbi:MAG: hypothetical protein AB1400_08640 [Pseudomonadota bacterium]
MLTLPERTALVDLFQCEPRLAAAGVPWHFNTITFDTAFGEDCVQCVIEPDEGELHFVWRQGNITRISLKINSLAHLSVHRFAEEAYLLASSGKDDPNKELVKIRLRPIISVEWGSYHDCLH